MTPMDSCGTLLFVFYVRVDSSGSSVCWQSFT